MRKSSCIDQSKTDLHKDAVAMMVEEKIHEGGSEDAQMSVVRKHVLQHRSALDIYMKMVFFLTSNEIPHKIKFKPLLELVKELGITETNCFKASIFLHVTILAVPVL